MRRAAILTLRSLIVLLLAAAVLDAPLPARSRDRVRVHLVDRSASVLVGGPADALRPRDADAILAHDAQTKSAGDLVQWASFGKDVVFESRSVDASGSDLDAALRAVLARNPTEIVLYSDGRGDPGPALFLCRERGVPIHVFPLGPRSVRDVRFRRLHAPAEARDGERFDVELTVESSFDVSATVSLDGESRVVALSSGVPATLVFPGRSAGRFRAGIEVADDCPENNVATLEVFRRSLKRPVLVISANPPALPDFDVTVARSVAGLNAYDAVVLDNLTPTPAEQETLAAYVRDGGGLLLLGGASAFAYGGWKGTILDSISPLRAFPDQRVALVFGIDSSGSMGTHLDTVVAAVEEVRRRYLDDDDLVFALSFADNAVILPDFDALRRIRTSGGTRIAQGIEKAIQELQPLRVGRKQILLMTDGETSAEEKPEERLRAVAGLGTIGLTIVTTNRKVDVGRNVEIKNWGELEAVLKGLVQDIGELRRENPGVLVYRDHPVTRGAGAILPPWIHRCAVQRDAQVAATVGRDDVLAFRQEGRGRVGAIAFIPPPALCARAVEYVAGDGGAALSLSVDPPLVRARGSASTPSFTTAGVPVSMRQVASDAWEGTLPPGIRGTAFVRHGRARAAATIPCPPEFAALGVDRAALERIAWETGGRVLGSPEELATLPRPERSEPRSGRTLFLWTALALVFAELGAVVFWKV